MVTVDIQPIPTKLPTIPTTMIQRYGYAQHMSHYTAFPLVGRSLCIRRVYWLSLSSASPSPRVFLSRMVHAPHGCLGRNSRDYRMERKIVVEQERIPQNSVLDPVRHFSHYLSISSSDRPSESRDVSWGLHLCLPPFLSFSG
jgi:hypothetical protein